MPNQRSQNQEMVPVWMDGDFLDAMDKARTQVDENRSQFIRAAVRERLEREHGMMLREGIASAPTRAGKRKKVNYRGKPKPPDEPPEKGTS